MDSDEQALEGAFLLENKVDDQEGAFLQERRRFRLSKYFILTVVNVTIFILWITSLLFLPKLRGYKTCRPQDLIYTPASEYLEYHKIEMDTSGQHLNEFMDVERSDMVDNAWHELMQYNNIRLTEDELTRMNQTSVPLGDGGYLAMPAVFHELHCLKMVRWGYHRNEYLDKWSDQDVIDLPWHIEHCIDILRQAIMCRADTSMITYWWTDVSRVPETDFFGYHECVNWDILVEWFEKRKVDIYAEGVLNHPKYGQCYPNGHRLIEDEPGHIPETLPFVPFKGQTWENDK